MKTRAGAPVGLFSIMLFTLLISLPAPSVLPQENPPYRNPKLPLEQRVADLLSRMTLEEKIAQLTSAMERSVSASDPKSSLVDAKGMFQPERATALIKDGIGQISRPSGMRGPRQMAEFTNSIQKWAKENTRLGIPVLFHEECLHGHAAVKGTSFPQAIALASTWDPEIVEDVFSATANEVRARGSHQCLTPVLDVARDPRWGRTEETYGEDPYLASRIGVAAVKGFQGTGPYIDKSHVIATAKHFAVHGQPEGGANVGPGNYSERIIREFFLKPFEAAVKEGNIQSVMASYNEIDGVPSHGNKFLLDNILRQEWGFNGIVVSDYFGIRQLRSKHFVVGTGEEAAKLALESGVDIELPYIEVNHLLLDQVKQGMVSEAYVDRAAARILRSKFITGLFDDPFVDPDAAEKITNSGKHQQLALEAARKSIILLKNEGSLLPLNRANYKRIAVIGPNAKEVHLGGYSGTPGRGISILDGIKAKVGTGIDVTVCRRSENHRDARRFGDDADLRGQTQSRRSGSECKAHPGSRGRRRKIRPYHSRAGRKRTDVPRSLGESPWRPQRPRPSRQPGRPRQSHACARQTHRGVPDSRPPEFDQLHRRKRSRNPRRVVPGTGNRDSGRRRAVRRL